MTTTSYERVAELISHIRNARYGEMVEHSERLIDSGAWRDYTTPIGTHFQFESCEFDYFLAVQEVDPTLVRHAYASAADPPKLLRLADITGRGQTPNNGDRRPAEEVAKLYVTDPSGAAARIEAWRDVSVVAPTVSRIAGSKTARAAVEAGKEPVRARPRRQWRAERHDDPATQAQAIVDRLADDPTVEERVFKILRARYDQKRRSDT